MDVQMPDVDGLAATVIIRQRERASGTRVPIIAMTAHAMSGDRERCLDAGMDDYLSKPVRPADLVAAVERITAGRLHRDGGTGTRERAGQVAAGAQAVPADDVVFDADHAIARLGGDRKLLRELITIFRADAPSLIVAVRKAAAKGDAEALRRAAHTLKGALGTLDAMRAHRAAARLEDAARNGDLEAARLLLGELETELSDLHKAIAPARRRSAENPRRSHRARRRPGKG
jgi:HPt (histidine-containing phosphotransfer) domain-containing protein